MYLVTINNDLVFHFKNRSTLVEFLDDNLSTMKILNLTISIKYL